MSNQDSDLDEFSSNEDPLTQSFNNAATHLQSLVSNVDHQTLLTLYAFYKQGSEGACNTPKPNWYDVRGKAKWEAWKKLGDMSKEEARNSYVDKIKEIDPTFISADLNSPRDFWVKVSTLQNTQVTDKNIVDFIRENNVEEVKTHLQNLTVNEINQIDNEGLSLLHYAADFGASQALSVILEAGINVNLQDEDGQTALHYASSCGQNDCIKLLLTHKADPNILDGDGKSPISVAYDDAVKSLLMNLG